MTAKPKQGYSAPLAPYSHGKISPYVLKYRAYGLAELGCFMTVSFEFVGISLRAKVRLLSPPAARQSFSGKVWVFHNPSVLSMC